MAQRFDDGRLELEGEPFLIAEKVEIQGVGYGVFSASQNGLLAYRYAARETGSQLQWFERTGKQIGTIGDTANYTDLELSPDGRQASVNIVGNSGQDIWIYDA